MSLPELPLASFKHKDEKAKLVAIIPAHLLQEKYFDLLYLYTDKVNNSKDELKKRLQEVRNIPGQVACFSQTKPKPTMDILFAKDEELKVITSAILCADFKTYFKTEILLAKETIHMGSLQYFATHFYLISKTKIELISTIVDLFTDLIQDLNATICQYKKWFLVWNQTEPSSIKHILHEKTGTPPHRLYQNTNSLLFLMCEAISNIMVHRKKWIENYYKCENSGNGAFEASSAATENLEQLVEDLGAQKLLLLIGNLVAQDPRIFIPDAISDIYTTNRQYYDTKKFFKFIDIDPELSIELYKRKLTLEETKNFVKVVSSDWTWDDTFSKIHPIPYLHMYPYIALDYYFQKEATDPSITVHFQKLCLLEPYLLVAVRDFKPPEIFENPRLAEAWKIFDSMYIPDSEVFYKPSIYFVQAGKPPAAERKKAKNSKKNNKKAGKKKQKAHKKSKGKQNRSKAHLYQRPPRYSMRYLTSEGTFFLDDSFSKIDIRSNRSEETSRLAEILRLKEFITNLFNFRDSLYHRQLIFNLSHFVWLNPYPNNNASLYKRMVVVLPKYTEVTCAGQKVDIVPQVEQVEFHIRQLEEPKLRWPWISPCYASTEDDKTWQIEDELLEGSRWDYHVTREHFLNILSNHCVGVCHRMIEFLICDPENIKIFLEIVEEGDKNQAIYHSGVCWTVVLNFLPLFYMIIPRTYWERFHSALARSLNSLITLEQIKTSFLVYKGSIMNDDTAASFGEMESSLISGMKTGSLFDTYFREERDWEISLENVPLVREEFADTVACYLVYLLEQLNLRAEAENQFDFYFERNDDWRPSLKDERLQKYLKDFYSVFFLVFTEKHTYYSTKGQLEKLKDLFVRLRDMLHYNPQLRIDAFFNPEFKKIFRNLLEKGGIVVLGKELNKLLDYSWTEFHATELIGKPLIGQFNVLDMDKTLISSGRQAHVYIMDAPTLACQTIGKIFHDKSAYDEISAELELLIRTQSHPHMVHIYGYILENNQHVGILMEYCSGGTVTDVISDKSRNYNEATILQWSAEAASGLMFLHDNGITHRDVKPDNMLLTEDGVVKISDLGLSKLKPIPMKQTNGDVLITNTFCHGTAGYRAPEIEANQPYTNVVKPDNILLAEDGGAKISDLGVSKMKQVPMKKPSGEVLITNTFHHGTDGYRAPEIDAGKPYTNVVDVYSLGESIRHMIDRKFRGYYVKEGEELKPISVSDPVINLCNRMISKDPVERLNMKAVFHKLQSLRGMAVS